MKQGKELQKHLSNIKFNADKWEESIKELQNIKIKIIALEVDYKQVEDLVKKYSNKTRRLARLEIV